MVENALTCIFIWSGMRQIVKGLERKKRNYLCGYFVGVIQD